MRALLWLLVIGVTCVSLLIACYPAPVPISPLVHDFEKDKNEQHMGHAYCDDRGICCYAYYNSCVATRIEIIVLPGEVHDEESARLSMLRDSHSTSKPQRDKQTTGEVQSRDLEARLLRQYGYRAAGVEGGGVH